MSQIKELIENSVDKFDYERFMLLYEYFHNCILDVQEYIKKIFINLIPLTQLCKQYRLNGFVDESNDSIDGHGFILHQNVGEMVDYFIYITRNVEYYLNDYDNIPDVGSRFVFELIAHGYTQEYIILNKGICISYTPNDTHYSDEWGKIQVSIFPKGVGLLITDTFKFKRSKLLSLFSESYRSSNIFTRVVILKMSGHYEIKYINSLEDFQKCVGGNIELLYHSDPRMTCYVNEEGLLLGLGYNLWSPILPKLGIFHNRIVGNIIVCSCDDNGNVVDIAENVLKLIQNNTL